VAALLLAAAVLAGFAVLAARPGAGPLSARDRLLLLADAAGPGDGDAGSGTYSQVHLRRWVGRTRIDSQRWRAPDGSGRLSERRRGATVRTEYPAGGLRLPFGEPFPATAAGLRAALPGAPGAAVTALLDAIGIRYLDPAERAAVLRVLAGLPGLTFTGAGPGGLGFALDASGLRLGVAVDPATGAVTGWRYGDAERVEVLDSRRVPAPPV
jgi:hypothetical protein